jgi:hypothetical protein
MSWVRTCSWARQVALLAGLLLAICFGVAGRRERLAICAVHGRWLPNTPPNGVCRNKSLCLRRHRRKDAVLVKPHAVGAAAVLGGLET